ncbi:type II toxin-antitoxin system RelE/ParE family toxin [Candidatus Kaiserbacteria bacterium]|nr:type II toxin-antitoxin system RelE/ParE family toxin [Candidatus Kaiserbacteria bacterium]
MSWIIVVAPHADKELRNIPHPDIDRIRQAIDAMETDPLAGDIVYLTAHDSDYRRRVGDWRIFFSLEKAKQIVIIQHIRRRASNTY